MPDRNAPGSDWLIARAAAADAAERLGREAGERLGETIAGAIEPIILKLADAIAATRAEQAELRDEVHALSNQIESVSRTLASRTDHLA